MGKRSTRVRNAVAGTPPATDFGVQERPAKRRQPARDIAANVPIVGFTGVNGAGKSTLAVESAIADMAKGRMVVSTVPISSPWGESVPLVSLRQLLSLENCTVLLDDVSVIFSSRSTQSLPPDVVAFLQTARHKGITIRWTAPEWMRCDNLLRGVTQGLVNVSILVKRADPNGTPWPRPLIIQAGLLDTTVGKVDQTPTRVLRRRLYIPRRMMAWDCYDTHAPTPMLGVHLQGGMCVDCGGTVTREKHSRERHEKLGLPWFGDDLRAPVVPSAGLRFEEPASGDATDGTPVALASPTGLPTAPPIRAAEVALVGD